MTNRRRDLFARGGTQECLPSWEPDSTQRWRDGRPMWAHPKLGGFDKTRYWVEAITRSECEAFVSKHHYLPRQVVDRSRFGLFDRGRWGEMIGVCAFGIPGGQGVLPGAFPGLVPVTESLELSRFVLRNEAPANAETWFLNRSFDFVRELGVRGVVAFSDANQRTDVEGHVVFPGHKGLIYQASNALYTGLSSGNVVYLFADGSEMHWRTIQKVRRQESGWLGTCKRLQELGARNPRPGEDPVVWLNDAFMNLKVRMFRSQGLHRYLLPIGSSRRLRDISTEEIKKLGIRYPVQKTLPTKPFQPPIHQFGPEDFFTSASRQAEPPVLDLLPGM